MNKLDEFPEALGQLDERIQVLRELVEKKGNASEIGKVFLQLHLDWMSRIMMYKDQLHEALGHQLFVPELTMEENLPRATTALRMLGQLHTMVLEQIEGVLASIGGPPVIALQQLEEWAKADLFRQEFLLLYLAAVVDRAKRSRKKDA